MGTDTITASYAATLDFNAASGSTTETISALIPPSFTISVTPNPVSAGVGNAVDLTVTVTGQDGFAEGVNLSCGNLPNEANCFFAQAAIASGGGSSPVSYTDLDVYKRQVGDFNGDGISDLANIDLLYQDTLLGQKSGSFALGLNHQSTTNQNFNVVAAGHFSAGASNKPADLLVQSGPSLIPYAVSYTHLPWADRRRRCRPASSARSP